MLGWYGSLYGFPVGECVEVDSSCEATSHKGETQRVTWKQSNVSNWAAIVVIDNLQFDDLLELFYQRLDFSLTFLRYL